ncbi:hypothetical protein FJZ55_10345 [Candidatus Woesearchaeota archaeon]|nr:hypothetical protein [Candidatus Woesearchaeota archaeon]
MTTVNNLSVWPETLPPPRVEGYSLSPRPSLLRTEMETGAARHRLRSLTAHYQVQAEWRFSQDGFAIFDAWWALNTRMGEQWFVLPLAVPLEVQAVEARFLAPWQAELLPAQRWRVAAQLEIRDLQRLTADELAVASVYGDAAMALADRLHHWLHQQMPQMTAGPSGVTPYF